MIPKILHTTNYNGLSFNLYSTGKIGTAFRLLPLDIELCNPEEVQQNFENLFRHWPEEVGLKWHLFSNFSFSNELEHARAAAIENIGRNLSSVVVHLETKASIFSVGALNVFKKEKIKPNTDEPMQRIIDLNFPKILNDLGFSFEALSTQQLYSLSHDPHLPIFHRDSGLDLGTHILGSLKMIKSGRYSIGLDTLANLKDQLPEPFEIVVQMKKIPNSLTQLRFNQIAKREAKGFDLISGHKTNENQSALANMELKGDSYFGFEMHVLLRRESEQELKSDLQSAYKLLSPIGDFTIESVGSHPSYISTLPGGDFHFAGSFEANIDKHEIMPCYLPVFSRGSATARPQSISAMAFHRLDLSVDFLDIFDRSYENYCLNLIGRSGTGKSVFLNRNIFCSAFDESTRLIIVDVKGSHTRLVDSLGGTVHLINLKESSGINPFSYLLSDASEYTQNIIKTFVTELMLDDDEKRLSIEEDHDLEAAIIKFCSRLPKSPDLDQFIKTLADDFPRLKYLKRFETGNSKKIFLESKNQNKNSKIHYYNFQNIDLAGNVATSRAIMAAIMADFNFQLGSKQRSEKLIFLCDETPFFIHQCFRSFKLLSKNVRSLYGSLVLTVQVSSDLIVDSDQSLIDNAGTKIFFSQDETRDIFKERFRLTDHEAVSIGNLRGEKGRYSQFFVKDRHGGRIGNLMLTGYEYWQSTTESYDLSLLERLRKEFPEVPEDDLISFISKQNSSPKRNFTEESIL